ncbi:sugar ABC transporter substrate-binding protein [Nonomuraea insulae]|uniref:Sugar ABC transporter substrate-binding protein n=1 Tax=Nonomuraea insulae TaxID=1616787 RepID=A0ABW1CLP6_9ACTN
MPTQFPSGMSRREFALGALGLAGAAMLTGCGSASSSGGLTKGGLAAYSNKGMDFFFFVVQNEAVRRASEALGLKYQTNDAKADSSVQYNHWNTFLLQKPVFLISDPIDSEGLAPLAQRAKSQKIPVGIIDTPLTKGVVDFTIAFDNRKGGQMAAQRIVTLLQKRYGTPKGKVLNGYGALSSSAWRARKDGFEGELKKYPGIQLISRPTEGDETKARAVAEATLSEFPDLDAAHAPSDSITRGIVTSLKGKGRALPRDHKNHVILTSIDGEPQSLQWTRDGILDAEVSQDPIAYGEVCVEMLTKYVVAGKPIPIGTYSNADYFWEKAPIVQTPNGPSCIVPPYFIDESNVDDPRQWGNVVTKKWGMSQT